MLGRNPFSDPMDQPELVNQPPTTPVIKLIDLGIGMAVFDITMLDPQGQPVVTLHRFELRLGDSFAIADLSVNLSVNYKE